MTEPLVFPVPNRFRRGAFAGRKLVETGRQVLDIVAEAAGLDDFSGLDILDFGSGYRMAQVLLEYDMDFGSYVGVDLDPEMIEWVSANCPDDRISFELVPFANEMYRPDGEPMTTESRLPVGDATFDTIWMFSVVTHLTPEDTRTILTILRRHLRPGGFLFFTCFSNPTLEEDFVDAVPENPLQMASYREGHLFDILDETGWAAEYYREPLEVIQYHLVCRPTDDPHPPRPERRETEYSRNFAEMARKMQGGD